MKKRLLASVLTLMMILSLVPTTALAVEDDMAEADEGSIVLLDAATEEEACPTTGCTLEKGHEGDCDVPAVPYDYDSNGDGTADSWNISSDTNEDGDVVYAYVTENSTGYTLHFGGKGAMQDFSTPKNTLTNNYDYATSPWGGYQNPYYKKITDLVFEEGNAITSIGNATIYGENNLTVDVVLPGTITSIGELGFIVTPIKSIKFPDGLTSIGSRAFERCAGLTEIDLSNTKITALTYCFNGCTNLSSVQLPAGLTSMGLYTFKDCTSLTSIELPDSLTSIGQSAFQGSGLTSIDLNKVTEVASNAFLNCENLAEIDFGQAETLTIGWAAFQNTGVTELTISENVTVGSYAFAACPELTKVTVCGTFKSDSYYHFQNCSKLETAIINVSGTVLKGAFDGCVNLKDVTIGDQVTSIGELVFRGCTSLTELTFPATTGTNENGGSSTIYKVTVEEMASNSTAQYGYINNNKWGTAYSDATLVGWYTGSGTAASSDVSLIGRHNNQAGTFYAVFSNEVTFDANGGTGSISDDITSYFAPGLAEGDSFTISDKTCTLPSADSLTREGYTLSSWNTEADGSGTNYTPGEKVDVTNQEIKTLYAQWTPNTYTIKFNGGEGTSGTTDSVSATYDTIANLTTNGFTKEGYNFAGWSKSESGTTIDFSDGAQVKNLTADANGTVTLYAVWTDKQVLTPDVAVQTKTYNGTEQSFTLDSSYTITYQQDGEETTPKNAGTYDVVISAAETDDTAAYKNTIYGGLVIEKATLTITADNQSIYVGGTLPTAYTYTVTGLVGNDTESVITTKPTVTCSEADANTAGKYTITASGADAGNNYTIDYITGTLTVNAKSNGSGSSSSSSTYAVSVDTAKNGTVSVSPKNASKGTTVTITAKPNDGYEVDEVIVTDKNGDTVKVTAKGDDKYTFVMPAGKVDVEVTFVKETVTPSVSFTDVKSNAWYYDAALYAAENGLMSGTGNGAFSPDLTTSRAMIWTILARVDGQNISVTYGNWYDKAQAWAISAGVSDGTNPDSAITREQLAVMLYGFAKEQGYTTANGVSLSHYVDASDVSDWAVEALEWAVGNGLISSMGNNILAPTGTATRAQVAVILMNFCENIAK